MIEIKYFVRTTNDRKFNYDLDYTLLVDKEYKPIESFIKALYKIDEYNSVLLEDDLVLCKNFKEEIEKVISEYPNYIINFFTKPNMYFTTHFTNAFEYNQCTYYPKGFAKILADEMTKVYNPKIDKSWGGLENTCLRNLHIIHLVYRPCLVQHIDNKSIFKNGVCSFRNTPYFKDYLDKLNIDMLDVFNNDNYEKLMELLSIDRNKWYKELREEN